jgi:hypothetical protein
VRVVASGDQLEPDRAHDAPIRKRQRERVPGAEPVVALGADVERVLEVHLVVVAPVAEAEEQRVARGVEGRVQARRPIRVVADEARRQPLVRGQDLHGTPLLRSQMMRAERSDAYSVRSRSGMRSEAATRSLTTAW